MKKSIRLVILLLCAGSLLLATAAAQEKKDAQRRHNKSKIAEVDSFHDALYPVWHEYYPGKEWDKIRSQADELAQRKDAVMKLELKRKSAVAEQLRQKFGEAVDKFVSAAKSGTDKELSRTVLRMHERFTAFLDEVRQK